MHRQIVGSGNPLMDEIETYKRKKMHNERINLARQKGDHKLSQTMYDPHPQGYAMGMTNAKQLQLNHERCQEIERSNRILFERMYNMANKTHYETSKYNNL